MFFAAVLLCSSFFDSMELKVVFPLLFVIDLILAPIPSKERGRFGERSKLRMKLMAGVGLLVCLLMCVVLCDYQKTILTTLLFVHVEFLFKAVRERRRLCLNYYVN
jgi:hypothetical protein